MATNVGVNVSADGAGFHRTMDGIQRRIGGLKTALVSAFGALSLQQVGREMLNFADDIKNAAQNLDISTDAVQRFQDAARRANLDIGVFTEGIYKLDTARRKALGGDIESSKLLEQLGLSKEDLNTLRKEELFFKTLDITKTQPRNVTEGILSQMGIKPDMAGKIIGARDDLLRKDLAIVSEETINKLDALGDAIQETSLSLLKSLMPAFLKAAEIFLGIAEKLLGATADYKSYTEQYTDLQREAESIYMAKHGKPRGDIVGGFFKDLNYQTDAFAIASDTAKPVAQRNREIRERQMFALSSVYGKDVALEAFRTANLTKRDDTIDIAIAGAREAISTLITTITSPPDTKGKVPYVPNPIFTTTKSSKAGKPEAIEKLATDEMVKIGGILGIDAQYRMERIAIQSNKYLQTIAENTTKLVDRTPMESEGAF